MNTPSGPKGKSLPDPYVRIIAAIHISLMVAAFWLLSMLEGRQDDRSSLLRSTLIVLMLIGAVLIYFLGTTYSLSGWSRQDYRFHMLLGEIFAYMTASGGSGASGMAVVKSWLSWSDARHNDAGT